VSDRYRRVSNRVLTPFIVDSTQVPFDTTFTRPVDSSDNQVDVSTGVSAGTNVYGTFAPSLGALRGIRHTLSPSVSYSYRPAIQGRPSGSSVNIALRNAIDLKVAHGGQASALAKAPPAGGEPMTEYDEQLQGRAHEVIREGEQQRADTTITAIQQPSDTTGAVEEEVTKLPGVLLWSLATSLSQNSTTREYTWSNISSLVNLRVLGTDISLNQTLNPYNFKVLNTSLTSAIGIRGTHPFGRATVREARELNPVAADTLVGGSAASAEKQQTPNRGDGGEKGLPWDVSMGFSYSQSTGFENPSSTLNLSGSISLTQGWRVNYRTQYDVIDRDFLGTYYSVTRDLHCWQMSFSRQQLGNEWEFYFRIEIKTHPEIYAEEGSRGLGGGSFMSPIGQ